MSTPPPLTVLMAVHNGGPFLGAALESVAAQTFRDFEWLIIDDASTDGSTEILAQWAASDSRIRLIVQPENRGLTATLNVGLAEARGSWIARQDSDDISHPERFARQMAVVGARPGLALLGTNGYLIDDQDRPAGLINAPSGQAGIQWSSIFYNPFIHSSVIFHREKIQALGGYDPSFRIAQDYDLWLRIMERHEVDNLPRRLLSYRLHASSVTARASDTEREKLLQMIGQRALALCGLEEFATSATFETIAKLRGRLSDADCAKFWQLHQKMITTFAEKHLPDVSLREALCLLHWKVAGSKSGALAELFHAFAVSPGLFLRLMRDRLTGVRL